MEVVPAPHNNELQYYTDRTDNVKIENDRLVLTALKEDYEHRQYTSGRVYSKYSFRYGRAEIVAKTPAGNGLWPAIWLLPTENIYGTWPGSGEIDIFEGRGQSPNQMQQTIHFGSFPCCDGHNYVHSPTTESSCDHTAGFHKWTLDWTPNELVYKFDDEVVFRHNLNRLIHSYYGPQWTKPFDQYFHLVLNTAIGGDFIDGPTDDDVWNYPDAEFQIESVTITPLEDIITPGSTTCETDTRCVDCQDDTAECSGTNSYLQYHLQEETFTGFTCNADEASSNVDLCWSLKYYCHDPNAQNDVALGANAVCQGDWGTVGCCYQGDNGAACDHDALIADANDIYHYRYEIIDRCGNWKWDSNPLMHLYGDTTVDCAATTTTTTTTTTTGTIYNLYILYNIYINYFILKYKYIILFIVSHAKYQLI